LRRTRVVAGTPADVRPPGHTVRIQDRNPSQLVGVPLGPRLPETASYRTETCRPRPRRPNGPGSPPGPEQRVRSRRWIRQDLAVRHPRLFEVASKGGSSVPDEDEPGPSGFDLLLDAAQLRRLLFAEESTVVAEPDQHHRSLFVDRTQRDVVALEVEHGSLGESWVCGHTASSTCPRALTPFSQRASASPIGVEAGPFTNGQISSAIRRQLAVAWRLPRTA
jgi:hypothetical protein